MKFLEHQAARELNLRRKPAVDSENVICMSQQGNSDIGQDGVVRIGNVGEADDTHAQMKQRSQTTNYDLTGAYYLRPLLGRQIIRVSPA
jgi:hypothetical protein